RARSTVHQALYLPHREANEGRRSWQTSPRGNVVPEREPAITHFHDSGAVLVWSRALNTAGRAFATEFFCRCMSWHRHLLVTTADCFYTPETAVSYCTCGFLLHAFTDLGVDV